MIRSGRAVVVDDHPEAGLAAAVGSVAVVPVGSEAPIGALAVGRLTDRPPFTPTDLEHLGDFAAHTARAVEFARSDADHGVNPWRGDHEQAAAEVGDHVIGDLVTVGLGLRGIVASTTCQAHRERLGRHIDVLAATSGRIHDLISATSPRRGHSTPLSLRLLAAVDAGEVQTGWPIRTSFTGNINQVLSPALSDDAVAVVRDALSTTAHAEHIEVSVDGGERRFTISVTDDGATTLARSRLVAFLHRRAHDIPCSARQERSADGLTRLTWAVDLP